MLSPQEILSISSDKIAEFIQDQVSAKTLSALMKYLNEQLLVGDQGTSDLAARALEHLGFPQYA